MKRVMRYICLCMVMSLCLVFFSGVDVAAVNQNDVIYVIPLEQTVEKGLQSFLQRAIDEAEKAEATVIVIEMNTLGGEIEAAVDIAQTFKMTPLPMITYVTGTATSAGAYIALNTPMIAMAPGTSIGAAEPRVITGEVADPKTLAFWRAEMESAADAYDRPEIYAAAMVDRSVVIEGLTAEGELLSLTAQKAVEVGIADGVFKNRQEVLNHYGYSGTVIEVKVSFAEKLARFVTNPYVMPILLTIAFLGIAIEFIIPGFGLPGIMGISALGIFFLGHIVSGAAGYEVLILFVLGVILLAIELFVPGGIFGIAGFIAMGLAIVLAAHDTALGIKSLFIALLITVVVSIILIKYFGFRGVWNKFVLSDSQQNEAGYVAPQVPKDLLGQEGIALTPLRPAGTARFADDYLADVVGESGYITQGKKVKVVKIEGTRIVVREVV